MADLFGAPEIATQPPDALPAGERRERGAYYTPDALALAICRTLDNVIAPSPETILEPGCGGGAFLRAARAVWPLAGLVGLDLVPACDGPGAVLVGDIFKFTPAEVKADTDLVLGNPDFAIAEKVVRHCLDLLAPGGHLAFLLRASFLGSSARVPLYAAHPLRYLQPIAQRPSFTGGGSDPMEYALFVWQQGHTGRGEILPPLVWR